jgi:transcription termination/antitermination protein NusG
LELTQEALSEKFNATLDAERPSELAWYAIWLRSHCEHLVNGQLSAKGFHTFLPELPTLAFRRQKNHGARTPMFPGYLFVRDAMEKQRYIDILKVRGIVRVLEAGWTRLTPVPDEDIDAIQRIVQAEVPVFPHAHLQHGDRVRVIDGPLSELEGIFVQDKFSKGRLVVSVNLLGRSVAVEVDIDDVEECAPSPRRGVIPCDQ